MFLVEHLVHKLLRKINSLLVSFIKIPVMLKICSKKLYFVANFQLTANGTKHSILYVASVLDTRLIKLSIHTFKVACMVNMKFGFMA